MKKRKREVAFCDFYLWISPSGLKDPQQLKLHLASTGTLSIGVVLKFRGTRLVVFK